ncbi:hypothetical protein F0L99_25190 [Vibrio parahaemolyticus]|nr:hypothetical protein [Vibrio parahaemolyticus]
MNCRLRKANGQRELRDENKGLFCPSPNAALRGEQRDATQLKPLCHKHKS